MRRLAELSMSDVAHEPTISRQYNLEKERDKLTDHLRWYARACEITDQVFHELFGETAFHVRSRPQAYTQEDIISANRRAYEIIRGGIQNERKTPIYVGISD